MTPPQSNLPASDENKELIAIAVHQLRTSLTSLKWLYSMAVDGDFGPISPLQLEVLGKANKQNERMLSVVNDLLTLIKNDSPTLRFSLMRVDMNRLSHDILDEFAAESKKRSIALTTTIPDEKIESDTDCEKMRIVLENLVSNALKYSDDNGAVTYMLSKDETNAIVTVVDHGIGVPTGAQPKLFQKFFRAENAIDKAVGSGLGLYTTKRLLEQLGGTIAFTETAGGGATFTVTIPLHSDKQQF
jgi:signal transduction histidine kinase